MASWRTNAEIRAECIERLGRELGEVYHALRNRLTYLQALWLEYRAIFSEAKNVELANKAGPFFFRLIQDELFDAAVLHLTRLTDQAETKRRSRRRLTFDLLPGLCEERFRPQLRRMLSEARKAVHFAHDRRDHHIAHFDFDTALGRSARVRLPASRLKVTEAIAKLHEILDYVGQQAVYHEPARPPGADALLSVIRDGLRHRDRGRSG